MTPLPCGWTPDRDTVADRLTSTGVDPETLDVLDLNP